MRGCNLLLGRFLFVIVISVTILGSACFGSSKSSPTATETIATSTPVATATPTCTDETAFALVRPSVARVAAGGTVASGVVVGDDLIFTSAIPVQEGEPVTVGLNGQAADGHVVAVSLGIFALIEAPTMGAPAVNWGYVTALAPGRRLLALGFGPDTPGDPASSDGIFSAIRQEGALRVLETDIRFPPGTSGGPVFTQCGQVVGLAIQPDAAQNGRAIPADSAQDFLRDLERARSLPPSASVPASPTPAPAGTSAPAVDICGRGASVSLTGASPIGHTYHAGDAIALHFSYVGPGCKSSAVTLSGFHAASSPMYEYWCVAPAPEQNTVATWSGGRLIDSWAVSEQIPLKGATMAVTIPASDIHPPPPSTVDPMEGFTVCEVTVELNEARFPGHTFQQTFGGPCL